MTRTLIALSALCALFVSTDANALIYTGTPDLDFRIDRSNGGLTDGDVYVSKVRVYNCGGGFTDYTINKWVDPVAGYGTGINGGDLCSARWYWGSDIVVHGAEYEITAWPDTTTVNLDPIKDVDVLPWKVTQGSTNGASLELYTTVD